MTRPARILAAILLPLGAALAALPAAALTCAPPEDTVRSRSDAAELVVEGRATLGARLAPAPEAGAEAPDAPPPKDGAAAPATAFRLPGLPEVEFWAVTVEPIAAMKGAAPDGPFAAVWRKGPCDLFAPSGEPQVLFFIRQDDGWLLTGGR